MANVSITVAKKIYSQNLTRVNKQSQKENRPIQNATRYFFFFFDRREPDPSMTLGQLFRPR